MSSVWLRSQDGLILVAAVAVAAQAQDLIGDDKAEPGGHLWATMPSGAEWAVGTFPTLDAAKAELDAIEARIEDLNEGRNVYAVYRVCSPRKGVPNG